MGLSKAILDTNFLLIPSKFRVDIFSELEKFGKPDLYTLDLVIKELEKIKGGKLALKLIEAKKIKTLKSAELKADKELLRLSKKGYIICTQDRELIKKITSSGGKVISMRQKKYLKASWDMI